jgi:hypothetical protein
MRSNFSFITACIGDRDRKGGGKKGREKKKKIRVEIACDWLSYFCNNLLVIRFFALPIVTRALATVIPVAALAPFDIL